MASKFDQNKYKKVFENRFGSGSYESGLSNAREIGKLKTQASIQKQLFMEEFKKRKKEQEEQDLYGKSKKTWEAELKAQGKITDQQQKAQDQGRGGHLPTRENAKTERAKTEKATKAREKKYAKGFLTQDELSEMTPYARQQYLREQEDKAQKEETESLAGKVKDFFTSKDKDGDGKRDGLLGLLEKIDRPDDAFRSGIKESLNGGSFLEGAKKGWSDKEYTTSGKDLNKKLGFDPDKDAKDKVIANILGREVINKLPLGEFISPFLSNKTKNKLGKETAGFATEVVSSPSNLIGSGLVAKGAGALGKVAKGATKATRAADEILGLPAPKPEPLGLPEPQIKLPEPKQIVPNINRPKPKLDNPIPQIPDVMRQPLAQARLESKGLNFGIGSRYEPKASKRMMMPESTQNQAYWQKRYEEFVQHVNNSYDMNRMTPEALDDIWTQFARYDEPVKLDEVVDLAYPKGFEAPAPQPKQVAPEPIPVQEAPVPTIKDDLRADPRINELVKGLYPPQKPISRVATPDEIIKMMQEGVASQKKTPQDILRPLQFSREKYVMPNRKPLNTPVDETAATLEAGVKPGRDYEAISPKEAEEPPLLRADDPITDMDFDPTKMKDISGFKAATTDVYRIFRDTFGKDYEKVGKPIIGKLDGAKKEYVNMQTNLVSKLKTDVVEKLNIKKGSKESALVQQYGEKKITLDQLKQQAPDRWRDIVKAEQWFRSTYDNLIDTINASRSQAYPNRPEKLVPKLDNYYRHFRELNGLEGLKNIFDSPSQIDPHLAGLSQHTNPNSKFHGFMQKRGLGPYKNDAVGGFLEYIPNAAYATHIDQVIPVFKNLRRQLADGTADSKNINNFIEFLYNYSNDLAGKTNPYFDRNLQQLVGRKPMAVLNWVNNRVKKNVILGNIGSTLAQLANIPNGIAYAKPINATKGAKRTLTSIFDNNAPLHKSPFLQERYLGKMFREFDQRLIDQPEKLAGWMIETSDRIGTSFVWNSVYEKGLSAKVKDPIAYADDITRKLIAGRGIGEVPLMQKSKAVQLVMPFTLEVANLWRVMGDFVKTKDFGALATLFVGNFVLNKGMEETRGSAVTFDPIDAIWDAFTDEELSGFQRVGRVGGEVLTNVPLGQHIAGLYPENGQVFNIKGPTRKELFGERDPQRFGTGLVAANSLSDVAFKFALPFGGNQLKKTLSGAEALMEEGSYIKDAPVQLPFVGDNQKLRYPVEPNPWNSAKSLMFGPSATNEAQEYYDNKSRPLSENQTQAYEQGGKEYYNNLMAERQIKTVQSKIKEVEKDKSLSQKERQEKLLMLYKQLQSTQ